MTYQTFTLLTRWAGSVSRQVAETGGTHELYGAAIVVLGVTGADYSINPD